jgi:hypothetical protein
MVLGKLGMSNLSNLSNLSIMSSRSTQPAPAETEGYYSLADPVLLKAKKLPRWSSFLIDR